MEPALVICCCLACVALGSVWGRQLLACELTRPPLAGEEGRTPVCLRGRFYYVVPEGEYNRLTSAAIRDRVNQNLGQERFNEQMDLWEECHKNIKPPPDEKTDWHGVGGW